MEGVMPIIPFGSTVNQPRPLAASLPSYSVYNPTDSPTDPNLQFILQTILKSKRIVVLAGAGISCASGIPDFRGANGLFDNLKRQHPSANISSGKDLFDASLFSSEANAAIFYTMIAELKTMADQAEPTAFHRLLKSLDDDGKLFRVYTQNIDGLEEKVGLSYGLGDPNITKKRKSPSKATKLAPARRNSPMPAQPVFDTASSSNILEPRRTRLQSRSISPIVPSAASSSTMTPSLSQTSSTPTSSVSPPADGVPRCIPLHGTLGTLYCPHCKETFPLAQYVSILASGTTLACPACEQVEAVRAALGDRSRGIGRLKPDVVLYGETHKQGERIGDITRRDLMGTRPDLLIVVGTSLKVPGTKLLVRELAKVIKPSRVIKDEDDDELEMPVASGSTTLSTSTRAGTSSPRKRRITSIKPDPVHVIYLNAEFPSSPSEWKNVFDVWCRGDVQEFVAALNEEKILDDERKEKKRIEREKAAERKLERERKKAEVEQVKLEETNEDVDMVESAKVTKQRGKSTFGGIVLPSNSSLRSTSRSRSSSSIASSASSSSVSLKLKSVAMGKTKSTGGAGSVRLSALKAHEKIVKRTSEVRGTSAPVLTSTFAATKAVLSGNTKKATK